MENYFYDICYHLDNYDEKNNIGFPNPVNVGDRITDGAGNGEFVVFQVCHSIVGGGSSLHVKQVPETL